MKSCKTCPSYMQDQAEIQKRFGGSLGTPICGKLGTVLGRAGYDNDALCTSVALKCKHHGAPIGDTPVEIVPKVAKPNETILVAGDTGQTVTACTGCANYIKPEAVAPEFRWGLGLCAARGDLIFKPMKEAKMCPWAKPQPGGGRTDTLGVELLPEYEPDFRVSTEAVVSALIGEGYPDPLTYETDAPVSPEHAAQGIRAWFKVPDPEDESNFGFLPTFDPNFFSEEDRVLIPQTGDDTAPELYVDYSHATFKFFVGPYEESEILCLVGEAGTGKTNFVDHLGWRMQLPVRHLPITEEMDSDKFLGHPDVIEGEHGSSITTFTLGELPKAYTSPGLLSLEEWNTGPDELGQRLRSLGESARTLTLPEAAGQKFIKDQFCFPLFTQNPSWDIRNIGTKPQADADFRRTSYHWVPQPPEPILRHIIKTRCKEESGYEIPEATLDVMMKIRVDILALAEAGRYPNSWGTSQELKVAKYTRRLGLVRAYKMAALDNIDPATAKLVFKAIATNIGQDVEGVSASADPEPAY